MASKLEICNMALSYLNKELIDDTTSLESSNEKTNRLCRLHFDNCKKTILRSAIWKCAKERATLSQDATGPAFGNWTYSYELPPDYIFAVKINEVDITVDHEIFYDINKRSIVTNETTLNLEYVANVETGYLDPLCVESISYMLAGKLAYAMEGNSSREQELLQVAFQTFLPKARYINSIEGYLPQEPRTKHSRRFIARRRGPNG